MSPNPRDFSAKSAHGARTTRGLLRMLVGVLWPAPGGQGQRPVKAQPSEGAVPWVATGTSRQLDLEAHGRMITQRHGIDAALSLVLMREPRALDNIQIRKQVVQLAIPETRLIRRVREVFALVLLIVGQRHVRGVVGVELAQPRLLCTVVIRLELLVRTDRVVEVRHLV